jgi:crossover junction endodeoxyribonuclease RuvC
MSRDQSFVEHRTLEQKASPLIIGIDPGSRHGGIAFLDSGNKQLLLACDTPSDCKSLAKLIALHQKHFGVKYAVVEEVSAMTYVDKSGKVRGQGAAASFTFGRSLGMVEGVLGALEIPIIFTKPSVWKALMGLSSDKKLSRDLASKKFPGHTALFARVKDDGRAEAALLALFGAERFK